jgi:hypothetical protein
MALIDDIIKWFMTPKTIKGIAGMIVIIIILAADFAWWAGQEFATAASGTPDGEGEEEEMPYNIVLDIDDTHTGTLLLPSGGTNKNPGVTVAYIEFDVKENATLGFLNLTPSGTKARPDFDLRVYGPDGDLVSESATEQADEYVELEDKDFNRTGPGMWMAEVDNYSSFNIGYTLTIQIHIKVPIEESDEP